MRQAPCLALAVRMQRDCHELSLPEPRSWHCLHPVLGCVIQVVGNDVNAVAGGDVDGSCSFVKILRVLQCFFYVFCSSWSRPWWILALAFGMDLHFQALACCGVVSVAAACALALDDATFGSCWHLANIAAAFCAPLFPPKKSKRGTHLKRENRRGAQRLSWLLVCVSCFRRC